MSALVDETAGLAAEHEALLSFLYLAPVGLVQFDGEGRVRMINPRSAQLLMPLSRAGNLDDLYEVLAPALPDLRQRIECHPGPASRICDGLRFPLPALGGRPPRTLSLTLLKLDDETFMAVLDDVTEQARHERLVQQSQAVINALLTEVEDYAIVTLDADGRIVRSSAALGRLAGWVDGDIRGAHFDIFDGDDAAPVSSDDARAAKRRARLRDAERDGWSLADGWQRRSDGSRFWGTTLVAPIEIDDARARGWFLVIRHIDDRRHAAEDLLRAVHTDFLTGVQNRRAFVEAGERAMARVHRAGGCFSLAILDVDHFKRVNDQHGHATGDAALKHLASRLQAALRQNDVLARIGGEEFALLLPGLSIDEACAAVTRSTEAVAASHMVLGGLSLRLTVSAGVTCWASDDRAPSAREGPMPSFDTILDRADRALYAAKAAGRNTVRRWNSQAQQTDD